MKVKSSHKKPFFVSLLLWYLVTTLKPPPALTQFQVLHAQPEDPWHTDWGWRQDGRFCETTSEQVQVAVQRRKGHNGVKVAARGTLKLRLQIPCRLLTELRPHRPRLGPVLH
jgi:hypothetical protein